MSQFEITGTVQRFPGAMGWYYVELGEELSKDLRPLLAHKWPALLKATFRIHTTTWQSSIMPIKNGPLFIALPAKIRKIEALDKDSIVTVCFELHE